MPKKEDGDAIISETGNWNVADTYVKLKIMKPLALADFYEDVASFGYESIIDEIANYHTIPNDFIQFTGLNRLVLILIRVIDNSKFALKIGSSKKTALEYRKSLFRIKSALPNLVQINEDQVAGTSTFEIKSFVLFQKFLNIVSRIKSKLNEPLNQNHLIFVDKQEFDPKSFKDNLKRRIIEKG